MSTPILFMMLLNVLLARTSLSLYSRTAISLESDPKMR